MAVNITNQVTATGDGLAIAGSGTTASVLVGEASVEVNVRDLCDTLREYCKAQGIRFAAPRKVATAKKEKAEKSTEKKQAA